MKIFPPSKAKEQLENYFENYHIAAKNSSPRRLKSSLKKSDGAFDLKLFSRCVRLCAL